MSHNLQTAQARDFALPGHRVLTIQGRDAMAFAQAQFMNDVARLADAQWQWNGWLTAKGRVVALFALLRVDAETLWLLVPDADPAELATQLQRFIFRSKARLEARTDLLVSGAFNPPKQASGAQMAHIDGGVELDFSGEGGPRSLYIGTAQATPDAGEVSRWRTYDLQHGLPRLAADHAEQWTPQQLSLDRLQAYSVKKGCYPGQEIVARTHFLGTAKRGLVRLHGDGIAALGDVMGQSSPDDAAAGDRALGRMVCAEGADSLAVMPLDAGPGPFRSNGQPYVALPLLAGLAR